MNVFWAEIEVMKAWATLRIKEGRNWGDVEYLPFSESVGVKFIRAYYPALPGDERQPVEGYFARAYFTDQDGQYFEKSRPYIVLI